MTAAPAAGASAQYAAWQRRDIPAVEEVRRGVWSIPTPMPDNPLRYVLGYAIETTDGLALVDTGWLAEECWTQLEAGIRATGHEVEDVHDILLTHWHYDHHGLTGRLAETAGARVLMHRAEADVLRGMIEAAEANRRSLGGWLAERGAPDDEIATLTRDLEHNAIGRGLASLCAPDELLEDGDRPIVGRLDLRVLWTPGHTDGHLCVLLEDDGLLLTGDHVLPRITPHVTRPPHEEGNPLGAYLRSLEAMLELEVDEVLPAHEYRFEDLHGRVHELLDHHDQRLAEIERAVPGSSTWDIARTISWSRGWEATEGMMRQTAVNETYTHLRHLEDIRRVRRVGANPDRWDLAS